MGAKQQIRLKAHKLMWMAMGGAHGTELVPDFYHLVTRKMYIQRVKGLEGK